MTIQINLFEIAIDIWSFFEYHQYQFHQYSLRPTAHILLQKYCQHKEQLISIQYKVSCYTTFPCNMDMVGVLVNANDSFTKQYNITRFK